MQTWTTGSLAGSGSFRCRTCDQQVTVEATEELPLCPSCSGSEFERAPLFTTTHSPVVDLDAVLVQSGWLEEVRAGLVLPGEYLLYRTPSADVRAYTLAREWTRIGRSLAADVRFDDPTVSRRHALIVRQPDGLRVLDDRSLNGVFVNGERVEWSPLADGDEIVIGRHKLHFVDVPVVSGMRDLTETPRFSTGSLA